MSKTREALINAIATLEDVFGKHKVDVGVINQLRDVLAEPEQEPVMIYHGRHTIDCGEFGSHDMEMLKLIPAGTKLYTSPHPREDATANALENIAAYLGIGGFNGATEDQLEARIKAEFDQLKPREWQELREEDIKRLFRDSNSEFFHVFEDDVSAISAALRAKNGG